MSETHTTCKIKRKYFLKLSTCQTFGQNNLDTLKWNRDNLV